MSTKAPIDLAQFEGHTPGPWRLDDHMWSSAGAIWGPDGMRVCNVTDRGGETRNNANAIEALPELLAELRERRQRDGELLAALDEFESLMRAWHSQKDDIAFIQYMTVNAPDFDAAIANAVKASAK